MGLRQSVAERAQALNADIGERSKAQQVRSLINVLASPRGVGPKLSFDIKQIQVLGKKRRSLPNTNIKLTAKQVVREALRDENSLPRKSEQGSGFLDNTDTEPSLRERIASMTVIQKEAEAKKNGLNIKEFLNLLTADEKAEYFAIAELERGKRLKKYWR